MSFFTLNKEHRNQSAVLSKEDAFMPDESAPKPDALQLQHTWVVWEQLQPSSKGYGNAGAGSNSYAEKTKIVAAFHNVRDFWVLWNNLPQPSELLASKKMVREEGGQKQVVDAIMIFKENIKPMWEDELNASGGHFQYSFRSSQTTGPQLDEYWNNLVLGLIGGTIDPKGMVTGVRLVDKLNNKGGGNIRIEAWFRDYADVEGRAELQTSIETAMCTKLDGTAGERIKGEMKSHKS